MKIPTTRINRLKKGVNLSSFLLQYSQYTSLSTVQASITASELSLIKAAGFTYVRLPVEPFQSFDNGNASNNYFKTLYLNTLYYAVNLIIGAGLGCIIDCHGGAQSSFITSLASDPTYQAQWPIWWGQFAAYCNSNFDPEYVFLEIENEPYTFTNVSVWQPLQLTAYQQIRANAPLFTILATGPNYSDPVDIISMDPRLIADQNVIWSCHFYDPIQFSHQGSSFSGYPTLPNLSNLPYPSTPSNVASLAASAVDSTTAATIRTYGLEQWNSNLIGYYFQALSTWAKSYGTYVVITEAGVIVSTSNQTARNSYIQDIRTKAEAYGIGWGFWEYSGGFGLSTVTNHVPTWNTGVLTALGLA
jgi:endoglucanase